MPDLFTSEEESSAEVKPNTPSETTAVPATVAVAPSPTASTAQPANKESHMHALSHYCEHPTHLLLEGKDIAQTVKLFVRRHIITNLPWIITTIVLLFIPLLIQVLITLTGTVIPPLPDNFMMVFLLFYYLIAFTYAFISFLDWFYNIIIITNTEIIDIDYADVVFHDVAATNVSLVEDVNYTQVGFIRGLFNFGDLFVQTAGGKENLEAFAIPQPAKIARIILNFIGKGEND